MLRRVKNPPNRYHPQLVEWIDAPEVELEIFEERAKSIIASNASPDVGFSHSVNAYRGCFHGCAYCYARRTHQYLDFGAGTDFERKLVVKVNAPDLLREAFMRPSWTGDTLAFSGVTDCYQPLEAHYELTRRCLEICREFRNPVVIITKGALVRRDIDILAALNEVTQVKVHMSIAFSDDAMAKLVEPFAPRPSVRFRALRELSAAGIPVGVGLAPIIPALNDSQIPEILQLAHEGGAESAWMTPLRLPGEVRDVFLANLHENFPTRAKKVINRIKAMRGGELNRSEFGKRMTGSGKEWEATEFLFDAACRKLGFGSKNRSERQPGSVRPTFRRPMEQLTIFELAEPS